MTIEIAVKGQCLVPEKLTRCIVSGTQEFVRLHFSLDEIWTGLTVFCQFQQGDSNYNVYLDDDGGVFLPRRLPGEFAG